MQSAKYVQRGELICMKWQVNHVFYPGCWQVEKEALKGPFKANEILPLTRRVHSALMPLWLFIMHRSYEISTKGNKGLL